MTPVMRYPPSTQTQLAIVTVEQPGPSTSAPPRGITSSKRTYEEAISIGGLDAPTVGEVGVKDDHTHASTSFEFQEMQESKRLKSAQLTTTPTSLSFVPPITTSSATASITSPTVTSKKTPCFSSKAK